MLKFIAKHSTIFMPLLCVIGMIFPDVSNAVLRYLPQILFFLMFFTLLGINQKLLVKRLFHSSVWIFAFFQCTVICMFVTILAYMLGARGDLLLAISAIGATAPLFGSGAIVNAVGFDALSAMAKTILATLLMPLSLLLVLWLLASDGATLDLALYIQRLVIYIALPIMLAVLARYVIPASTLQVWYPKVAQFNVLLLLTFPLGLMGAFRQTFDNSPMQALSFLAIAFALAFIFYFGAYVVYRKQGYEPAIIASLVCGGRNTLLTYTIAMPFLGTAFLPLIGALQFPMFCLPSLGKYMAKKHQQNPFNQG